LLEATTHLVAADPFLEGNHAPVQTEIDVAGLKVTGRVPDDLAGVYMRNGPNPKYEPLAYVYPFDGDGMVHAVYFEKGRARYRNRFVRTAGLAMEERAGRAVYGSVANPRPVDASLLRPGEPQLVKDNANINVIAHAGHYLALYEADLPYEITRELETVGPFNFAGAIQGMNAHPRIDGATGEMHFFNYGFEPPYLTYFVADRSGSIVVEQPIDLPAPTMIHDLVITERRVVFFDCPVVFDFKLVAKGESPIQWRPALGTRIIVLDRDTPQAPPLIVDTEAFWVFHFVNAYDLGEDEIVVDFVRHKFLAFGSEEDGHPEPTMHRIMIDVAAQAAKDAPVDDPDRRVEFPRTNDLLTGRQHRYGYAATKELDRAKRGVWDSAAQFDFDRGAVTVQRFGRGRYPGEPCFVPRPGAIDEDDGYVVTFVYSAERDKSDLVIVDARDFDGEPVATIELPVRVPYGLHGNWLPIADG
jgi:carotenoid cleavage dioxygenase-like enzyme